MMHWIRKQIWLWRDFCDDYPFRTLGLIGFMLIGGIIWGSLAGSYLRTLMHSPAALASPTPVFTATATPTPTHKRVRIVPQPAQPSYRPSPRHTTRRPAPTSHAPSPRPTKTKVTHGPCWPLPSCPPSDSPPPGNPTPTPGSQGKL